MTELQWLRQVAPMAPARQFTDDEPKPITVDESREHVIGPPLYQRGPFAVIDVVKDLEYVVVDTRTMRQVRGPIGLDLDEAKRVAEDMAYADRPQA